MPIVNDRYVSKRGAWAGKRIAAERTKCWTVNLKKHESRFYYAGSARHGEKILGAMRKNG